ncbi:hypothetical protein ACWGFX_21680 [Streptomyces xanthophaeus]
MVEGAVISVVADVLAARRDHARAAASADPALKPWRFFRMTSIAKALLTLELQR